VFCFCQQCGVAAGAYLKSERKGGYIAYVFESLRWKLFDLIQIANYVQVFLTFKGRCASLPLNAPLRRC